jgi:trimeric autotransporter adhesin
VGRRSGAGFSLNTGDNNIYIGADAGPTPTPTPVAESDTIRIGTTGTHQDTYIAGIFLGQTGAGGVAVFVNADGKLGTIPSSARFKDEIKPMDKASEAILSLRPVTFHYKSDTKDIPQFGLIAEEVAKVNPALVLPDKEGKPYTVRYDQVNAMLLNEFLKEHRKVEELEKQVQALSSGLHKVTAQLELSKPAPQTVENNR